MAPAKPSKASAKTASANGARLRRAAGEVLMVGLEGAGLSAAERAWLKLIRPGGIILFRRNIETPRQTHALLAAAKEARAGGDLGEPFFRAIDVEGGTVDRLRDAVAPAPSAFAVGATGKAPLFAAHGRLIGRELRLLGLNVTLAPVLDLRTAASLGVLATRAVSSDPAAVLAYAKGFLKGLSQAGVLGCGKHFPGLGSGQVDSHDSTPKIERSFKSLWESDLLPYRKLTGELALVMVAHAIYPLTPSRNDPASISRFWAAETLRKKIGFRGLVVSDDMEMGGILAQTTLGDAAIRALLAGTHVIEVCHQPAMIFAAFEALLGEAETSPAFSRKLLGAARRARAFKQERLGRDRLPGPPAANAVDKVRADLARFAEQVSQLGPSPSSPESPAQGGRRGTRRGLQR